MSTTLSSVVLADGAAAATQAYSDSSTKVATTAFVQAALTAAAKGSGLLSANGRWVLPGQPSDLIIQWGRGTTLTGSQSGTLFTTSFSEAFPTACLWAAVMPFVSSVLDLDEGSIFHTTAWTQSGVTYYYYRNADHGDNTVNALYLAIGY